MVITRLWWVEECLGRISLTEARGLGFSGLNTFSWPYGVMVSRSYKDQNQSFDNFLETFLPQWGIYQQWFRQQTLASYFGLPAVGPLATVPSWAWVWPWSEKSPDEMKRWLPPRIRRNRRQNGHRLPTLLSARKLMEFESLSSGESHGRQFFDLCKSIEKLGFYETCNLTDPFKVWVLNADSESRWVTYSGNHRIAAAVTIGLPSIHAERKAVISKSNLYSWPNVANGWFSKTEAESVFDNLFDGSITPETRKVISLLSSATTSES